METGDMTTASSHVFIARVKARRTPARRHISLFQRRHVFFALRHRLNHDIVAEALRNKPMCRHTTSLHAGLRLTFRKHRPRAKKRHIHKYRSTSKWCAHSDSPAMLRQPTYIIARTRKTCNTTNTQSLTQHHHCNAASCPQTTRMCNSA